MELIIPHGYYKLTATNNTILLKDPYNSTTIEQIKSIRNLTKNIEIYDCRSPRNHIQFKQITGIDITIVNGVITYVEDTGMLDTDKLQITIDGPDGTNGITILDGGSATSVNPVILDGGSV